MVRECFGFNEIVQSRRPDDAEPPGGQGWRWQIDNDKLSFSNNRQHRRREVSWA